MNSELQILIDKVKNSIQPVRYVVINYFQNEVIWSVLKDEWLKMSNDEKTAFINKIAKERK